MDVNRSALLELDDLDERKPHVPSEIGFSDAEDLGELASYGDRGTTPQLRGERIPKDRPLVVVAIGAEGLPEARVMAVVVIPACGWLSVWARSDGPRMTRFSKSVHCTERWCGKSREHGGMVTDRIRNALSSAKSRTDDLPSVALI